MIKNNRNNEQIYGRNDMIMLDQNNKIYGSFGIADKYVMKTEEGTMLALSNPKLGKFGDVLTEFNMYGRSEQQQYSGKNLLKIRDGTQTTRGVTITAKDGVVALKGTATETGWAIFDIDSFVLDGTCILSSNISTGVKTVVANKSFKQVLFQNKSNTLENAEASKVCFTVTGGKTYDISNILVQIEKGSKATSYEPYVGGQPSPSPDYPQEIKSVVNPTVKVCGKNLWNPILGGYISGIDGSIYTADISFIGATDFIKINGKDITVIARNFSLSIANAYAYRIGFYNSEKAWIKNIILTNNEKYSISTARVTDAEYIRVSAPSGVYDTIQIEKGSEATSYEPYHEQNVILPYTLNAIPVTSGGNVTIDGQQWVCDEIDLKRGVRVQRVYEVDVDGENTKFIQTGQYVNISVKGLPIALYDVGQRIYGISTFTCLPLYYNTISGQFLYLIAYDISDQINESCKKQMGKIYYVLAAPIETPLTSAEIAAFNAFTTYYPVTIIENNYNTWMKATYKSTESV